MIINIIAVDKKYAKEYAKDLAQHMSNEGKMVSYVRERDYQDREAFSKVCASILKFSQAYLIVTNINQPIKVDDTAVLPDLNIILLNENNLEQLIAASKITESLGQTYATYDQIPNIELAHVYNRVGVPKRNIDTTNQLFRPVRRLKQTA